MAAIAGTLQAGSSDEWLRGATGFLGKRKIVPAMRTQRKERTSVSDEVLA